MGGGHVKVGICRRKCTGRTTIAATRRHPPAHWASHHRRRRQGDRRLLKVRMACGTPCLRRLPHAWHGAGSRWVGHARRQWRQCTRTHTRKHNPTHDNATQHNPPVCENVAYAYLSKRARGCDQAASAPQRNAAQPRHWEKHSKQSTMTVCEGFSGGNQFYGGGFSPLSRIAPLFTIVWLCCMGEYTTSDWFAAIRTRSRRK